MTMPPPSAYDILERHEAAIRELHASNLAILALARSLIRETEAKAADDDEWTRLPSAKDKSRCHVSGWSRSTLLRHIHQSDPARPETVIRRKSVKSTVYYSAADVRHLLARA